MRTVQAKDADGIVRNLNIDNIVSFHDRSGQVYITTSNNEVFKYEGTEAQLIRIVSNGN